MKWVLNIILSLMAVGFLVSAFSQAELEFVAPLYRIFSDSYAGFERMRDQKELDGQAENPAFTAELRHYKDSIANFKKEHLVRRSALGMAMSVVMGMTGVLYLLLVGTAFVFKQYSKPVFISSLTSAAIFLALFFCFMSVVTKAYFQVLLINMKLQVMTGMRQGDFSQLASLDKGQYDQRTIVGLLLMAALYLGMPALTFWVSHRSRK